MNSGPGGWHRAGRAGYESISTNRIRENLYLANYPNSFTSRPSRPVRTQTMPRPTSRNAFDDGQRLRAAHVLHSGVYKLEEIRYQYQSMIDDIDEIARLKCGHTRHPCLDHCTTMDMAQWLKKRPAHVAFDLGYYLLPSIAALHGDHVPMSVITIMTAQYSGSVDALLDRCQAVQDAISKHIEVEYTCMREGRSLIRPLLCEMEALCAHALATAKDFYPHS